jgi:trehalose/maltose transport system substrate-binding protein
MSIRSLDQVQQWFGTITPPEVFSLDEQMLSDWWRMGRGIFMRYQAQRYLLEPPDGSTVVAPLPRGTVAAATVLSGWQLAVSKYSQYPKEAQAFIEFMTSMESQRVLAQRRYLPANRRVYAEPDVQAVDPIYSWALGAMSHAILRPSTVTASRYSEVSEVLQHGVAEALQKQQVPQEAIQNLADRLSGIKAAGW